MAYFSPPPTPSIFLGTGHTTYKLKSKVIEFEQVNHKWKKILGGKDNKTNSYCKIKAFYLCTPSIICYIHYKNYIHVLNWQTLALNISAVKQFNYFWKLRKLIMKKSITMLWKNFNFLCNTSWIDFCCSYHYCME